MTIDRVERHEAFPTGKTQRYKTANKSDDELADHLTGPNDYYVRIPASRIKNLIIPSLEEGDGVYLHTNLIDYLNLRLWQEEK